MMDFQPIETFVGDPTWAVFFWRWHDCGEGGNIVASDVYRYDEKFFSRDHGIIQPTHWLPLPAPPQEKPDAQ